MLALVTTQCHMQMAQRHGVPGVRQPIGSRERGPPRPPEKTDKGPGGSRGAQGVSAPCAPHRDPRGPERCRDSPGDAAGGTGAEVVVQRGDPGAAAVAAGDHRPGCIAGRPAGTRSGAGRRALGAAAALARGARSLCGRRGPAHATNWNVQTADGDVTKGPPAPRHGPTPRRPIPSCTTTNPDRHTHTHTQGPAPSADSRLQNKWLLHPSRCWEPRGPRPADRCPAATRRARCPCFPLG